MAISITKPTVNGSNNTWGDTINTALDTIVDAVNGTSGLTAPNLEEGSWQVSGTIVQASGAELNILNGATVSAAEINLLDGSVSKTVVNNKAVVYGSAGEVAATTVETTTVDLGDWTITQSGTSLKFAYQGNNRFSLSSTGALTVENDITAYGSA